MPNTPVWRQASMAEALDDTASVGQRWLLPEPNRGAAPSRTGHETNDGCRQLLARQWWTRSLDRYRLLDLRTGPAG